jgi:hypothetical protein
MAEFDVTINRAPAGQSNGLYSPNPAFWSASTGGLGGVSLTSLDPPITSGIFQLNPDGTTTVAPVLTSSGAPILEGDVPEPATWWVVGSGALALLALRKRK